MSIPILNRVADERFLTHRLRSTSIAGIVGGVAASLLFAYRYYHDHFLSWDLFAIALTIALVKLAAMLWYRFTD